MTGGAPDHLKSALADRYVIEREIGRGGMATVYLAKDLKHQRKVAVKVLLPELAATLGADRFLQEIRVTANLQHPHILPLYDSGRAAERQGGSKEFLYYVMPYVEGESLRGLLKRERQLSIDDALRLTEQIASALDYAHRQDVIHRDIKPENILLHEGVAMVADFGIALAVKAAGGERLTETGLSIGTPEYMSPEQVAGEREIDARSDVYSLACVLYEMLAGQPPFTGATGQAILARHVTDPVPPIKTVRPGVSDPLAAAITTALGKAPADRFDSARLYAEALRAETAATEPETKSIVVLPFANLSPDPENEYFADGLTEEIITDLSQIRSLLVISRNSSMQLKNTEKDTKTIGRELGVRYVLEGTVRKSGDRLRITAQLIDTETDAHLWANKFTGTLDDVFELQESVSRSIVDALQVELSPQEQEKIAEHAASGSVEAYDLYLLGRHHMNRLTKEGLQTAVDHFQRAVEFQPDFAKAYAGLADSYMLLTQGSGEPPLENFPKARAATERALEIDPSLEEAHTSLGGIHLFFDWKWEEAEREFRRAIDLNPNYGQAHHWLAISLFARARHREALDTIERALALDPLSPYVNLNVGWLHYGARDYDGALTHMLDVCGRLPDSPGVRMMLGTSYMAQQRYDEAITELEHALELTQGEFIMPLLILGFTLAHAGRTEDARKLLHEMEELEQRQFVNPDYFAIIHIGLGEHELALDRLEQATDARTDWPIWFPVDPMVDPIRSHPRFMALLDRIGLSELANAPIPGEVGVDRPETESMVVLPFENLSPDPDNEYFADGLTEELIAEFTKISALRVISRTSAMRYKGTDKDLPTIGQELNVHFVLEGSVRKAGNSLRITAQLIDATTDSHLWADKYSGTMEDIFSIQEQVSRSIVESLRITLSPEEEQRISERPTESLEAYDFYLRGLDSMSRGFSRSEYDDAQLMFERAVKLDPGFAHAHAALSRMHTGVYHLGFDRTERRLTVARTAVDHALKLRPDLPEAHLALGWLYWTLFNHAEASAHFRRCLQHQPNDPQLWRLMGLTKMWQGDWHDGIECQKKAMWLDPRNPVHATNVGAGYRYVRDYEQAVPHYERAIGISPDWIVSYVELAYLYLAWKGDTSLARSCLERAESAGASDGWLAPLLRVQLDLYDGNHDGALSGLDVWESEELDIVHGYMPRVLLRGMVYWLSGDRAAAHTDFIEAESVARAKVQLQPRDARVHSALGLALAGLGRADEAIVEGRAFETLAPVNKDGIAPYRVVDLAQIYILLGHRDTAVDQLEYLLSIPGPHSAHWVRIDPIWDTLMDVPRFRSLLIRSGVAADVLPSRPETRVEPARTAIREPKSIVVLPFENVSPDPENAFFADGLTEELIADLSKVKALTVISRTSAFAFKGTTKTVPTIAQELKVRYALEGSVRRAGNNLRITAQLIDTETDAHLWAEKYSGTLDDVFDLQEQLSRQIVDQLEVQLTTDEHRRLAARPIDDVQVHDIWLRARQSAITMTKEGLDRAEQLVQEALSLVGDNALLHATMAWVHGVHFSTMVEGADEVIDLARHHAAKAMELDPDLAWAHFVTGMIHHRQGRIQEMLNHARDALAIERDSHILAVLGFYLPEMGRVAAARVYAEEARARDPLSWIPAVATAYPEIFDGRAETILDDLRSSWRRFAFNEPWSTYILGFAALRAGREDEALERFRHVANSDNPVYSTLGRLFASALDGDGRRVLDALSAPGVRYLMRKYGTSCAPVASCLAHVGEKTQALDWLEAAVELGYTNHRFMGEHDHLLEPLRGEPRFHTLLQRAREKEQALVV